MSDSWMDDFKKTYEDILQKKPPENKALDEDLVLFVSGNKETKGIEELLVHEIASPARPRIKSSADEMDWGATAQDKEMYGDTMARVFASIAARRTAEEQARVAEVAEAERVERVASPRLLRDMPAPKVIRIPTQSP
jgi:hypothetical protein